jgi:hypothetical protein
VRDVRSSRREIEVVEETPVGEIDTGRRLAGDDGERAAGGSGVPGPAQDAVLDPGNLVIVVAEDGRAGKGPALASQRVLDRATNRPAAEKKLGGSRFGGRCQFSRRSVAQRVSSCLFDNCNLRSTLDTCVSTVFTEMNSSLAISLYA